MISVTMTVNGKAVTANIEPRTLLVQFLREHLRLTGTHVGCDTSQCGACVVHVNGKSVSGKVEARTLLVQFLRENLGMTGTHVGCDTSQCGACVVHVDGQSVKSCTMLAVQAEGAQVTTIEGLAPSAEKLHPMQEAFRDNHALQCGFCTPGMVMSAIDMVKRHNYQLDESTVRRELEGNLCRCTGYHNIVKAILAAAPAMKSAGV